jgi:hypothetical protein
MTDGSLQITKAEYAAEMTWISPQAAVPPQAPHNPPLFNIHVKHAIKTTNVAPATNTVSPAACTPLTNLSQTSF